jgi:hypothetical protein
MIAEKGVAESVETAEQRTTGRICAIGIKAGNLMILLWMVT